MDAEELRKVARLARLELKPEDTTAYCRQLTDILALVDQLGTAQTGCVDPMAHPLGMTQRLRRDAVTETVDRELFQAIAPAVEAGLYLVPRVLD